MPTTAYTVNYYRNEAERRRVQVHAYAHSTVHAFVPKQPRQESWNGKSIGCLFIIDEVCRPVTFRVIYVLYTRDSPLAQNERRTGASTAKAE